MNFFQKSSTPLLFIGIGILIFIVGLTAVSSLTEKTEYELIDSYLQLVSLYQVEPKLLVGSAGHKLNFQFIGNRSIGGAFTGENLVLTMRESGNQTLLLEVKKFTSSGLQEESLPANREMRQIVISFTTNLPAFLQVGTQIEGELSGIINYPIEQDRLLIEKHEEIDQKFNLKVISEEEMLKQVHQRPDLIMLVSFPLSMVLILLGIRTEFFGRKSRPQT